MSHLIKLAEVQEVIAKVSNEANVAFDNADALFDSTKDEKKRDQFRKTMDEQNAILKTCNRINEKIGALTKYDDKPVKES